MGKNILINAAFFLPFVFLAVFFFFPAFLVFLKAFEGFNPTDFFGTIFSARRLLWNSFSQAFLSTIAAFLVGFPAAYIVAKHEFFGKRLVRALSLVPFVMPPILAALSFVILFGNNGWLNRGLMMVFGFSEPPFRILYGFSGIILAHAFYNFPVFLRLVSNSWQALEEKNIEAAKTLGAGKWQVFFRVTLPQLLPSIFAAGVLVFIYCFMSFAIVLSLGGIQFSTLEVGIFHAISRQADFKTGATLALLQFAVIFIAIIVLGFFEKKTTVQSGVETQKKTSLVLFSKKGLVCHACIAIVLAGVLLPIIAILSFSLADSQSGFSLKNFEEIFFSQKKSLTGATAITSIFNSLLFASTSMTISVTMAFLLAVHSREKTAPFSLPAWPLAVSSITLGLGYIIAFGAGQWAFIAIAHALISLPFAFKIISNSLNSLPQEIFFAATTLGADKAQTLYRVIFPLALPAIASAAAFSFAVSLGELGITMLLFDGKFPTITVYIYRFISTYNIHAGAAMGVILVLFSAFCFYLIEKNSSSPVV